MSWLRRPATQRFSTLFTRPWRFAIRNGFFLVVWCCWCWLTLHHPNQLFDVTPAAPYYYNTWHLGVPTMHRGAHNVLHVGQGTIALDTGVDLAQRKQAAADRRVRSGLTSSNALVLRCTGSVWQGKVTADTVKQAFPGVRISNVILPRENRGQVWGEGR